MSMGNLIRAASVATSVMATNTTTPTTDRHEDDDEDRPGVGMSHVTVVPTNFEREDR